MVFALFFSLTELQTVCQSCVIASYTELALYCCRIRYTVAVVCGVAGVSVVRESTQGVAATEQDHDEISVPQLTQEGQYSYTTPFAILFSTFLTYLYFKQQHVTLKKTVFACTLSESLINA